MNKSPAARTHSVALFLFNLYTHASYIGIFISAGNAFVAASIVVMLQLALTVVALWAAFTLPRLFWNLCLVFFLTYPISLYLLYPWFPEVIYVEDPTKFTRPLLHLGMPILLLLLSATAYIFAYRKEQAARTLSVALFLFTLYTHAIYIGIFVSTGHAFVASSIVAMVQMALSVIALWAAFTRPRLFWSLCVVYFLSYPIDLFLLPHLFSNVIFVEDWTNYKSPSVNGGIPILLLLLSAATYIFVHRNEHVV